MKTVQLAIHDSEYAQSLRTLLMRDGTHRVYVVDDPDLRLDGVVVIDENKFESLTPSGPAPERFVVITAKGSDHLSRVWDAGVRHVVFEQDSPNTAQLAIIAAELRLPRTGTIGRSSSLHYDKHHLFPVISPIDSDPPSNVRCSSCSGKCSESNLI